MMDELKNEWIGRWIILYIYTDHLIDGWII